MGPFGWEWEVESSESTSCLGSEGLVWVNPERKAPRGFSLLWVKLGSKRMVDSFSLEGIIKFGAKLGINYPELGIKYLQKLWIQREFYNKKKLFFFQKKV